MEMFFLQHATGVASTKLTPTALRTLSGVDPQSKDLLALQLERSETDDQVSDPDSATAAGGGTSTGGDDDRQVLEYDPKIFEGSLAGNGGDGEDQPYNQEEVMEILKMSKLSVTEQSDNQRQEEESSTTMASSPSAHIFSPLTKKRSFIGPGKGIDPSLPSASSPSAGSPVHARVVSVSRQIQDAVRLSNEVSS
jgi:hypothetical protein